MKSKVPSPRLHAHAPVLDAHLQQGLTLVHFSAQLEPFLTQNIPYSPKVPPHTYYDPPIQPRNAPPIPQKALTLSRKMRSVSP